MLLLGLGHCQLQQRRYQPSESQVIDDLAVINTIAIQPTDSTNGRSLTPIIMEKVEVVIYSAQQLLANFGFSVGNH